MLGAADSHQHIGDCAYPELGVFVPPKAQMNLLIGISRAEYEH
jgi:hypothetical protein